jgi:hypothetical protein
VRSAACPRHFLLCGGGVTPYASPSAQGAFSPSFDLRPLSRWSGRASNTNGADSSGHVGARSRSRQGIALIAGAVLCNGWSEGKAGRGDSSACPRSANGLDRSRLPPTHARVEASSGLVRRLDCDGRPLSTSPSCLVSPSHATCPTVPSTKGLMPEPTASGAAARQRGTYRGSLG